MARGLDVGTMNIVSARQDGDETVFFGQRNSFVEIEYSDMAEQMLSRSDVLHIRKGDEVYVVGDDSLNFANVFNQETRRPMQHGILSSDEQSAIPMIKLIIEQVLGDPERPGERVYFSTPADPIDSEVSTLYHRKTLESFIGDMGYDPEPINEGMAVIYSELADANFTGLGISFGAGMTNICLSYYAVPVMTFSIARGGDWIDEQTANATGTNVDKVTSIKEDDFRLDFTTEAAGVEGALSIYYDNLLDYVIENIKQELDEEDVEEGLDVPVVVTGGTASPPGFEELFADKLKEAGLPFSVSTVSRASEPLYSVGRGALVASRTEEDESGTGEAPGADADATEATTDTEGVDETTDGAEAPAED